MERLEVSDSYFIRYFTDISFSTPYLVIIRNRGQELRFYRGQNLRLKEDELRNFLRAEDWKHTPVWSSSLAPGGDK